MATDQGNRPGCSRVRRGGQNATVDASDLREVTREIRPDWDLAVPGLCENWEVGDHSMHHPYQQADHMRTVTPLSIQKN